MALAQGKRAGAGVLQHYTVARPHTRRSFALQAAIYDLFRDKFYKRFLKSDPYYRCLYSLKTQHPQLLASLRQVRRPDLRLLAWTQTWTFSWLHTDAPPVASFSLAVSPFSRPPARPRQRRQKNQRRQRHQPKKTTANGRDGGTRRFTMTTTTER